MMATREGRSSHHKRGFTSRDHGLHRRFEECNKEQRIVKHRKPSTVLRVVDIKSSPTKPSSQTTGWDLCRINDLYAGDPQPDAESSALHARNNPGHALCKLNLNLHPCPRLLENDKNILRMIRDEVEERQRHDPAILVSAIAENFWGSWANAGSLWVSFSNNASSIARVSFSTPNKHLYSSS